MCGPLRQTPKANERKRNALPDGCRNTGEPGEIGHRMEWCRHGVPFVAPLQGSGGCCDGWPQGGVRASLALGWLMSARWAWSGDCNCPGRWASRAGRLAGELNSLIIKGGICQKTSLKNEKSTI